MPNFDELLKRAFEKRKSLFDITDAFRIANGIADGLVGVTLDKFKDCYQLQYFSKELLCSENSLVKSIEKLFAPKCLVCKERLSKAGSSLENAPMRILIGNENLASCIVREGNANFNVNLLDTINPGLFLDMRSVRLDIGKRANGMRMLNLFSYTCAFSVHARINGALISTNADISSKILDKGRKNYKLNNIVPKPGEFFKGNALEYVHWAQKKNLKFDIIVLDPPSFARFKGKNFNVREHLLPLVLDCATLLNKDGFIMVSSNYSGFELHSFSKNVMAAVSSVQKNATTTWSRTQDIDFTGSGNSKDSCLVGTLIKV